MPWFLLCVAGCRSPVDEATIDAELDTGVVTVVHVAWDMQSAGTAWVEYGPTAAGPASTPPVALPEGEARATLLGLPSATDVSLRVVVEDGGEPWRSEEVRITTGDLPAELPDIELVEYARDPGAPFVVMSTAVQTADGAASALVLDAYAEVVWYWLPPEGHLPAVRPSNDGTALLALVEDAPNVLVGSTLARLPLDGGAPTVTPAPMAHHDFRELADGTVAYIAGEPRDVDGETVYGDLIVEVAPDGGTRVVWDAFDALPVAPNDGWTSLYYNGAADWTHGNGLGLLPDEQGYLLSMYYQEAVVLVDRPTGLTRWQLGGDGSDFTFVNDDGFGPQHAPVWVDGGVLLFDNGRGTASRLVQYELDEDAGLATLTWSWSDPEGTHTFLMGGARPFVDGVALSGWGEAGDVVAIDEAGDVVWRASIEGAGIVGRVTPLQSLYPASAERTHVAALDAR